MDNVELQATCASLGYLEGDVYQKEPDCLETVKDLILFLKRENESCDIRRQLGYAQILQRDLLPIIKSYDEKKDRLLLETILRLMVNLTQPAKLCFQNAIPEDKQTRNNYLEVETHLQSYKEAFIDEALFAVLTKKLGDLLQLDWENRQEEDRLLIERILILVRNILHVPPNAGFEQRTDDDASIHDQVLWALHVSGMEDLLLYLASSDNEKQFAFHVLEITSLIFREQTAEQLASAGGSRSMLEKEQDERELAMKRQQEQAEKRAAIMRQSSRHSRFGGTFTVAKLKSISDREVIYHRSIAQVKDIDFDCNKKVKKRPKNRRPITEQDITRRSTLSIRLFLKEFCIQFLENCYNTLMSTIKDSLLRSKAQENDETYYLWAMRFFMEFNRKYNFRVELVSETLSVPTFHYIQTHLQNFHEMILSQKKEGIIWSRRMHLALKSYQELLQGVNAMDKCKELAINEAAKVLKSNIFYMMEYRDIFVVLLKKFDETRQSRTFLMDLIETAHLFLKMIENFCKSSRHLVVRRKKKKMKRRKKQTDMSNTEEGPTQPSDQDLEDLWDNVSSDLSAIFQGRAQPTPDLTPFDAASEVDVDEQRADAMYKIQDALRQGRCADGVALFRAAREVWPEQEQFGSADISAEEEFMALREVFFAALPNRGGPSQVSQPEDVEEEEEDYDEELEEHTEQGFAEEEFKFDDFVQRFAQPQIIKAYATMLGEYRKNTQYTNHCIVKMLHRVAFGMSTPGMMYQACLFRVFQKIMMDPACRVKHFEELRQFAKYIVRSFIEAVQKDPKVIVELFFWKNLKESKELVEGYGSFTKQKGKALWTEEQDMELRQLYDQFKEMEDPGVDVVDHIMLQIIDQSKTRRQVLRQLVHLDLIGSAKDVKKKKTSGAGTSRGPWREEQEFELRQLYDEHKDSSDPVGNIIANMVHPRAKNRVVEKLLEMGVVSDRKQLRKKRANSGAVSRKRRGKHREELDHLERGSSEEREIEGLREHRDSEGNRSGSSSESEELDSSSDSDGDDGDPSYIKQIKSSVRIVVEDGMEGPLEWLKNSLRRTADDREEDGDEEPVPLVPILDDQEDAMESSAFRKLLGKCGLKPPANEQERYWRIPGNLKPEDLRSRVEVLVPPTAENMAKKNKKANNERFMKMQDLIKKKNSHLEDRREKNIKKRQASSAKANENPATSDDEGRSDHEMDGEPSEVNSQSHAASEPTISQSQESSNQSMSDLNQSRSASQRVHSPVESRSNSPRQTTSGSQGTDSQSLGPKRKWSRVQHSVDSDESDADGLMIDESSIHDNVEPTIVPDVKPTKKRARLIMDSDSDSEKENATKPANARPDTTDNKTAELQSFPATMLTQDDSDSDLDDHVPLKRINKRVTVQSDSEDE